MIPQVKPWLGQAERDAAAKCVDENWLTEGPRSKEFVAQLCEMIDVPYGVLAPNGTLALALGLMALGIGKGDDVIVPDLTFIGSANAVILAGARPIFCDVDRRTFQMTAGDVELVYTKQTRAIMPVHLFGTAAPMDELQEVAEYHRFKIIEDAAQGIGVIHKGHHVGSQGDVGCFSFFADKTITTGEGGFVCCHDEAIYKRLLLLRNQGRPNSGTFIHESIGYNFRMTDMQAAIGLVQLNKLGDIIARKQAIYEQYCEQIDTDAVRILGSTPGSNLVPFRLVLLADNAAALAHHLRDCGVETRSMFFPLHAQPCFKDLWKPMGNEEYTSSNTAFQYGLCLPIFPEMTPAEVSTVTKGIREFYDGR